MKSYIKSSGFLILFFFLVGNCYSFAKNKEIKTQCIEIKSPQNDSLYCKFVLRDLKLDTTFVFKTGNIDSVLSCRNDYDWEKFPPTSKLLNRPMLINRHLPIYILLKSIIK